MKGSSRENLSVNSYLSYRVKDVRFRNELVFIFNKAVNSPYGSFRNYALMNPYWAPYDEFGETKFFLENVRSPNRDVFLNSQINPVYNTTLNTVDESKYRNFSNNFVAEWKALDWLRFTGRFSYQVQNDESDNFKPAQHTDFATIPLERFYERGSYLKGYGRMTRMDGSLIGNVNNPTAETVTKTLNFGTEIDPYLLQGFSQGLYQSYWSDYITDLYDASRRVFTYKAQLPLGIMLNLKNNDKLTILERNYIINSIKLNLTTGEASLELLNDV